MMFQTTGSYFQDRLAEPGGLNEYVTEFLSLAFIHPYGASVVIALLLGLISGCFFLYLKACGVRVRGVKRNAINRVVRKNDNDFDN